MQINNLQKFLNKCSSGYYYLSTADEKLKDREYTLVKFDDDTAVVTNIYTNVDGPIEPITGNWNNWQEWIVISLKEVEFNNDMKELLS